VAVSPLFSGLLPVNLAADSQDPGARPTTGTEGTPVDIRYLPAAIARSLARPSWQRRSRQNAARALATCRQRRREWEDAQEYLARRERRGSRPARAASGS